MSAFQRGVRGAARKARGCARWLRLRRGQPRGRHHSLLVAALAVLFRSRYEWSLDAYIDGLLDLVGGLLGG